MKKIFGIRHHGPGSARSLLTALEAYQPDCVLIEGPPDADDMIPLVANEEMQPPIALLIYNPKSVVGQAAFYPFAAFSPEWIAMQFAIQRELPVRFMDLPMGIVWNEQKKAEKVALDRLKELEKEQENKENSPDAVEPMVQEAVSENENDSTTEEIPEDKTLTKEAINRNPIAYLARLANYEDAEQWWENVIEQRNNDENIFEGVLEMMTAIREELEEVQTEETLLREAYMRRIIRGAEKEGHQRIAVICGAWHAPALETMPSKKTDDDLLKGRSRPLKTESTWIPWTYQRLSRASGYGAGITSPAWYEALYEKTTEELVPWWMSRVARLFRDSGQDASPAHVMEACRLAYALAGLRGRSLPILGDFLESVRTIFCFGDELPLQLIKKKLVIGEKMGSIPDDIPQLPLHAEILKLKHKFKLKDTKKREPLKIDLRTQLAKSQFLHQLNLLNIPYGKRVEKEGAAANKGSFNEYWKLEWQPEFELGIIEAATYGNTLETACNAFTIKRLDQDLGLFKLTQLLEKTFLAGLPLLIDDVTKALENKSAASKDVLSFMQTIPRLVGLMRYSDVRKRDTTRVAKVVESIFPRMLIGLPIACTNIASQLTDTIFAALLNVNSSVKIIKRVDFEEWLKTIQQIAESQQTNRKIAAGATRILFEKGQWTVEDLERNLSLALSPSNLAKDMADYVEGFLNGSATILIYNESLFAVLDSWIGELNDEAFVDLLPLLRRSFAHYSFPERQQLGELAKNGISQKAAVETGEDVNLNMENVAKILPVLKQLLA